jgi:hypothetical protein
MHGEPPSWTGGDSQNHANGRGKVDNHLRTHGSEGTPEEDRPSRRKHPQMEKKEDTVGSVIMINGAMSSTMMG